MKRAGHQSRLTERRGAAAFAPLGDSRLATPRRGRTKPGADRTPAADFHTNCSGGRRRDRLGRGKGGGMSTLGRVCLQVSGAKLKQEEPVDTCACFRAVSSCASEAGHHLVCCFVCTPVCRPRPRPQRPHPSSGSPPVWSPPRSHSSLCTGLRDCDCLTAGTER